MVNVWITELVYTYGSHPFDPLFINCLWIRLLVFEHHGCGCLSDDCIRMTEFKEEWQAVWLVPANMNG